MLLLFLLLSKLVSETTPLNSTLNVPKVEEVVTTLPDKQILPNGLSANYQERLGTHGQSKTSDEETVNTILQDLLENSDAVTPDVQKTLDNSTSKDLSCNGCDLTENMFDRPYQSVVFLPYTSPIYYWFPQSDTGHVLMPRRAVIGHGHVLAGGHNNPYLRRMGVSGRGGVTVLKPQLSSQLYNTRNKGLRSGFLARAGGIGYIGRHRTRNADEMVMPEDALAESSSQAISESPDTKHAIILPGTGLGNYHFNSGLSTLHGTLANTQIGPLGHSNYFGHQGALASHHYPFRYANEGQVDQLGAVELLDNGNFYLQSNLLTPTQDFRSVSFEPQVSQGISDGEYSQPSSYAVPDTPGTFCSTPECLQNKGSYYSGDLSAREHGPGYYSAVDGSLHSGFNDLFDSTGLGMDSSAAGNFIVYSLAPSGLTQTPLADSFNLEDEQTDLSKHSHGSVYPAKSLNLHPLIQSSHLPSYNSPQGLLHSGLVSPSGSLGTHGLQYSAGRPHSMWPAYGLSSYSYHPNYGSLYGNLLDPAHTPGIGYTPAISGLHANFGSLKPGVILPHHYSVRDASGEQPHVTGGGSGAPGAVPPAGEAVFTAGPGVDAPLEVPPPSFRPDNASACNGSSSGYNYRKYSHSNVDYGYGEEAGQNAYLHLLTVQSGGGPPSQRQSYPPAAPLPYHRVRTKQGYDILKFSHSDSADHASQ